MKKIKKEQTIGEFAKSLGMTFEEFDKHFSNITGKVGVVEIFNNLKK